MEKTSHMTNVTPLPGSVAREVAVRFLHDHVGMIELNPLVIHQESTSPPPGATEEEQRVMKWYAITDEISYLPGGWAKSEVTYKGGFYDLDYGLQTHVFAPAGVEIKGMWKVGGNMPGEPAQPTELGVELPKEGLYLREDVELKCNFLLTSFVKKNLKKSHQKLVDDLIEKANNLQYAERTGSSADTTPHTATLSQNLDQKPLPEEPCSCSESGHDVMCPNYRYVPASSRPPYNVSKDKALPAGPPGSDNSRTSSSTAQSQREQAELPGNG
ncbi:hypothetical protein KC365_g14452 [Hortaea werneckii]|nr:hypothetical protein KC365_g14452 [Hortaea werneckii]KAI7380923.1 hypothetical protein KC328_g12525 [Hortaea werneckii]